MLRPPSPFGGVIPGDGPSLHHLGNSPPEPMPSVSDGSPVFFEESEDQLRYQVNRDASREYYASRQADDHSGGIHAGLLQQSINKDEWQSRRLSHQIDVEQEEALRLSIQSAESDAMTCARCGIVGRCRELCIAGVGDAHASVRFHSRKHAQATSSIQASVEEISAVHPTGTWPRGTFGSYHSCRTWSSQA